MTLDPERWAIVWVREYRQFVIEPPIDYSFDDNDGWFDGSYDTIAEAMNFIDRELRAQPVIDSRVKEVEAVKPVYVRDVEIPAYLPRGVPLDFPDDPASEEPLRQYSPSEGVGGTTPVTGQEDRLSIYARRVGLQ